MSFAITSMSSSSDFATHRTHVDFTSGRQFWAWYALLVALTAAEIPFARAAGFVLCVFLTLLTVARLGARSAPIVAAMALAALLALVFTWAGLVVAYVQPYPVSVYITSFAFGVYVVVRDSMGPVMAKLSVSALVFD